MDRPDAVSLSAGQARAFVLAGIEDQVAALRALRPSKRVAEIAAFAGLWAAGAALTLAAYAQVAPGWPAWGR